MRDVLAGLPKLRSALSNRREMLETYGKDSPGAWCEALRGEIQPALAQIDDRALSERIRRAVKRRTTSLTTGGAFLAIRDEKTKDRKPLLGWLEDPMLGGVIQHESRSHMASDLARYLYVSSYTEHEFALNQASPPLEFWPKSLLPKHANVRETRGRRIVEGFSDRFRVQVYNCGERNSVCVGCLHLHYDCMSLCRLPQTIESYCTRNALISTVLNFVLKPTTQLID